MSEDPAVTAAAPELPPRRTAPGPVPAAQARQAALAHARETAGARATAARAAASASMPLTDDPMGDPPSPASVWNVANALTVLRLLLVPAFVLVLFEGSGHDVGPRVLAWAVFAVASVTDRIDGEIARKKGLVTDFGKLADPIADKALVGAALIGLSLLHDLPWWVTVVMLARELGVTLLRFWVIRRGVIPASRGGKLKTLLQGVAIGLFVLVPVGAWLRPVAWVFMVAALIVALATGFDYVQRAVRLRRAPGVPAG